MLISVLKSKAAADCWQISVLCIQSGAVFREPAAAIDHRASGKHSTRQSMLSKVQQQLQCKTENEYVGVDGMTQSLTLPC